MSKDLYPSHSSVIDLRNKITPAPSKTKQFFDELQKLSGSSPSKALYPNRTYESERWFSPRPDAEPNTSIPPRRSMLTPSRLQNMSAQRSREARKPYWRCPMPAAKSSGAGLSASTSNIERILREGSTPSSSLASAAGLTTPGTSITTSTVRQAPMKSFIRRREPETGKKTNIFTVDDLEEEQGDEEVSIIGTNEDELSKVPPLNIAPTAGFLSDLDTSGLFSNRQQQQQARSTASSRVQEEQQHMDIEQDFVFTFAAPISRGPKCLTPPPPPKLVPKEAAIQTEAQGQTATVSDTLPFARPLPTTTMATTNAGTLLFGSPIIGATTFPTRPTTTTEAPSTLLNGGSPFGQGGSIPATAATSTTIATVPLTMTTTTASGTLPFGASTVSGATLATELHPSAPTAGDKPPFGIVPATNQQTIGQPAAASGLLNGGFNYGGAKTATAVAAPLLADGGAFKFGGTAPAAAASLTNGGFQFGQPATTTAAISGGGGFTFGMPPTSGGATTALGGFQFGAVPAGTDGGGATFQFGTATAVNGSAFQFAEAPTDSTTGLSRTGVSARKIIQARRAKKR